MPTNTKQRCRGNQIPIDSFKNLKMCRFLYPNIWHRVPFTIFSEILNLPPFCQYKIGFNFSHWVERILKHSVGWRYQMKDLRMGSDNNAEEILNIHLRTIRLCP